MNVLHRLSDAPEAYNSAELELVHDPRGFPPQASNEDGIEALHSSLRDIKSSEKEPLEESLPDHFLKR